MDSHSVPFGSRRIAIECERLACLCVLTVCCCTGEGTGCEACPPSVLLAKRPSTSVSDVCTL